MMPCVLVGSLIGTYFYTAMPDLIIQIILTITLLLISLQSIYKLRSICKKERDEIKKIKEESVRVSSLKLFEKD